MLSLLAQAAADQYGNPINNNLPETGFPLPLAVLIGLALVVIGVVFLGSARR